MTPFILTRHLLRNKIVGTSERKVEDAKNRRRTGGKSSGGEGGGGGVSCRKLATGLTESRHANSVSLSSRFL